VLVAFRLQEEGELQPTTQAAILISAMLFGCAGMLPLIKGSFAVIELGIYILCVSYLALHRLWKMVLICSLAPLIAMLLFWVAVGQRLADLPGFFSGNLPIVSGYTDAMSLSGPRWELLLFPIGVLAILLAIAFARGLKTTQRNFLLLAYASYLLICFKAGFGRQDDLHLLHASGALAMGSLSLTLLHTPQQKRFSHAFCLIALVVAMLPFGLFWHDSFLLRAESQTHATDHQLRGWALFSSLRTEMGNKVFLELAVATEPHLWAHHPWKYSFRSWREKFEDARSEINSSSHLNFAMPGSVDVYPYDQSALLSRGYTWDPRPVLQSYSAYTPKLIRIDERHLRGSAAPEHIVFRVEPIDHRLPSLADGLSWPAMLDNYRVAGAAANWVHLIRKPGPLQTESHFAPLGGISAQLGREVTVPSSNGPIFAQIAVGPTFYGRLIDLPYKLPQLTLTLTSGSGRQVRYRVIAGMMETGFFISPLITDNDGFMRLFDPSVAMRPEDKVHSLRLDAQGRGWRNKYTITFRQYEY
jgi:hypothetical protein